MDSLENDNIKKEQICRTCLKNDGHYFELSHIFDHCTLAIMIQNITNLQMNFLDGHTQFICFQCVKEVRRANQFRIKCLESNDILIKVDTKTLKENCEIELAKVEEIKQELDESSNIVDCYLEKKYNSNADAQDIENDCEKYEDHSIVSKEQDNGNTGDDNENSSKIIFDCPLCHGLFSNNNIYQKHINEFHLDRLQDECFDQKREPIGYILKNKCLKKNKHVYRCVLDEFSGNSFVEFKNHMKEHTGEKPVVCIECGFRTTEISLLKKHRLQKHVEEKKFSCSLCNYTCQRRNALTSHLGTHTTEKKYKCKLCPMIFKYPSALSVHKKVKHEKRKSHVCPICQKAFFHSPELKYHMFTHTGERPHICHYCGRGFAKVDNMKTHISIKHEPTKTMFKCDQCSYAAKRKPQLQLHMKRHSGEKSFKCPQCPFSTFFSYNLKLHIMRHTGQKRYACDMCDYKCMAPAVIKLHKRIHSGEKPFSCNICNYSGKTREALKRHMQTHNSEQKFKCPNCPYKTNVRVTLTRHLRSNCVIKRRGRTSSKHSNTPSNIMINDEFKQDFKDSIGVPICKLI